MVKGVIHVPRNAGSYYCGRARKKDIETAESLSHPTCLACLQTIERRKRGDAIRKANGTL